MTSVITALALVASLLLQPIVANAAQLPAPFPDMETSWFGYQDSVRYLVDRGSINGYPDGLFHPKETVNRAEFLKLVFRSRGTVEPATGDCFSDVTADAWYAPYVCAAKNRGIVSGYKVGTRSIFRPDQPILFAEAVKMSLLAYGDEMKGGEGNDWFKPFVDELDRKEILHSASYIPWEEISRERAADLIARFVRHEEDRAIPHLSVGCGKAPKDADLTLTVNGQERSYLLDVPRSQRSETPSPLIVAFHGRTNGNDQVRGYFGLDKAATNYIVAYPGGIPTGNGSYSWSDPGDKASNLRDFAFFDAIVREVSDSYCVDMDRIFVVGHSLGAWFANAVACARGGIVRGSATVGGSVVTQNCSGPSAAMIINNPKDSLSPHSTAEAMRDIRVQENTCSFESSPAEPTSLSCVEYAACSGNPVLFCPHTIDYDRSSYYPHVWPRESASAMVTFFEGLH